MVFSAVIYLELFVAFFFLPGFFITVILGIKKFRFLLSFALSYSLIVLTLLPFEYYAQPISRWQWCVLLEWVILAVWAAAKTFTYGNFNIARVMGETACRRPNRWATCPPSLLNLIYSLFNPRLIVPLVLAAIICGYLAYAGIYLEIPSDVWEHVARFQWHKLTIMDSGVFPSGSLFINLFLIQGQYWHISHWCFIHVWLCHVSGLAIMDSLHVLTFANVLIFLLAIYYFGLFLFAGLRISAFKKMMMAAVASLFAAATMGNMVFAYIRYYAFAPAILNYVLFLAAMAVIVAWLRSNRWFDYAHHRWFDYAHHRWFDYARFGFAQCRHHRWLGQALWIVPVLIIVTNMVHTQEVLFIFFMTLALSIVETIRLLWRKFLSLARHSRNQNVIPAKAGIQGKKLWIPISRLGEALRRRLVMGKTKWRGGTVGQAVRGNRWTVREWKTVILAVFLLIVFFAGFAAIRYFKPGAWISSNMIMPHVGIPPELVNFIFRNLMISPPQNPWFRLAVYQLFIFYQVVGCWGLFVYLLFLLMIRHFIKVPYLTAGMIIVPLLTAFNPLTVDMIARLGQDPTIYRFHYLIPLPFIGGYLFVHFLGKAWQWLQRMRLSAAGSVSPIWPWLSRINFVGSVLVLAGLIGLVFPINVAGIYAPYSKIYTLRKIPAGNDYHLCDDLGQIMAKYENMIILTDGWTAKYLRYYSQKNTYSDIKWLNSSNPEKELPDPYTWGYLCNSALIVINRRNGGSSITGRIAKHWPEDVIPKVSRYYSLEAQYYLESHPETFRKIWAQNRIAVYAVR